jgi:hypothetical protein
MKKRSACTTKGTMNSQLCNATAARPAFNSVPLYRLVSGFFISPLGTKPRLIISALAMLCTVTACAQNPVRAAEQPQPVAVAAGESTSFTAPDSALPDDPSALLEQPHAAPDPLPQLAPQTAATAGPIAPKYQKYLSAGYRGQPLTARDKVIVGLRDLYSPFTILGDLASAGYSDLVDGQPNYGTDRQALGKRVGATFLRDANEGIFTDMVFAPLLHEDPRYYAEGPKYNILHRTLYAVTRPLITRTDSGKTTINGAMLIGYAGASTISYAYYPKINQNFHDTAATYGGSLEGAAIGFLVSEYFDDVFQALHLEKKR